MDQSYFLLDEMPINFPYAGALPNLKKHAGIAAQLC